MKKLAIIGGGRMACIFAENAREMGIETHCFSLESGIVDKTIFDDIHVVNILEREKVLEICKKIKVDGIVATTELTIAVASFVSEKMHLNGIPSHVAEVITDKYHNRVITKDVEDLFHPKYIKAYSVEEVIESDLDYPIIIKPTSKGGKRGITVVYRPKDIAEAFEYAIKNADGELPLIIEEYIDGGMEYSIESLSYNGKNYIIQITEKVTSGPPHCVELAHHQPANITPKIRKQIEKVIDKALTKIGIKFGPCHTEIKVKNNKIYLIEFNARPGGDHIAHPLTKLSTGYPYVKGAIEIALNTFTGIDKKKFINKYAGIVFVSEQTKELLPLFEKCESYKWCYKKKKVTDDLKPIIHNDGFNINYFIYSDETRPVFQINKRSDK